MYMYMYMYVCVCTCRIIDCMDIVLHQTIVSTDQRAIMSNMTRHGSCTRVDHARACMVHAQHMCTQHMHACVACAHHSPQHAH